MVDETTDVSNTAQMSYVLRYATDSGEKERFFQYGDVSGDKLDKFWSFWRTVPAPIR